MAAVSASLEQNAGAILVLTTRYVCLGQTESTSANFPEW